MSCSSGCFITPVKKLPAVLLALALLAMIPWGSRAQSAVPAPVSLKIDAGRVTAHVSPMLYGLMTEEINYSYDGGLYAELVRNRSFQDNADAPDHWTVVQDAGGTGAIALDRAAPLSDVLPVSLKLDLTAASPRARVGVANDGFWGIPVKPQTHDRASFYAKASAGFTGPLTVSIESNDAVTTFATASVAKLTDTWKKYSVTLTTGATTPSTTNRLVLSAKSPGTVSFSLVSLFPPTWKGRHNGNRPDLMQLLADLKPAFLRFPGGNYVQGRTLATRFPWQKTLGELTERPGHLNDSWKYRSSDGMGLLEFLEWCDDLKMQPVLAVFAGLTLDRQNQKPVPAGPELQPYVQEALDEIEYVIGDAKTTWGARRAKDGHHDPFRLDYVEIGNEDFFDRVPGSYDGRFAQCFDAIRLGYLCAIAAAQKTVAIGNAYFVPDDLAIETLLAARKRGVRIRIVVPAINDSRFGRAVSRSRWERLLAAGVEIYEYLPAMYHAKAMVVDDIFVTVGSANFDNRSFAINDEDALNIIDPAVARAHLQAFEHDVTQSRPVSWDAFQHRSIFLRLADQFCGLFRSQF